MNLALDVGDGFATDRDAVAAIRQKSSPPRGEICRAKSSFFPSRFDQYGIKAQ